MVVTSHPPLASGGHLVIAEALTRALRDAGHQSGLLCTPQNRFGRQGSAYVANWLTDVGRSHDGVCLRTTGAKGRAICSGKFPFFDVTQVGGTDLRYAGTGDV